MKYKKFVSKYDYYCTKLNTIVEKICAILLAAMIVVVWIGISGRDMLHLQISWNEELARYIMIYLAVLAISCGIHRNEHIGIDILAQKLNLKHNFLLQIFINICGLLFFLIIFIYSLKLLVNGQNEFATIFGMNMTIPYASIPLASFLSMLHLLNNIFQLRISQ